jgi:hypothetical protein
LPWHWPSQHVAEAGAGGCLQQDAAYSRGGVGGRGWICGVKEQEEGPALGAYELPAGEAFC